MFTTKRLVVPRQGGEFENRRLHFGNCGWRGRSHISRRSSNRSREDVAPTGDRGYLFRRRVGDRGAHADASAARNPRPENEGGSNGRRVAGKKSCANSAAENSAPTPSTLSLAPCLSNANIAVHNINLRKSQNGSDLECGAS